MFGIFAKYFRWMVMFDDFDGLSGHVAECQRRVLLSWALSIKHMITTEDARLIIDLFANLNMNPRAAEAMCYHNMRTGNHKMVETALLWASVIHRKQRDEQARRGE